MKKNSKIYISGHNGLVGNSIYEKLKSMGYNNIIVKTHNELDLINQKDTSDFFQKEKPEYVFMCAALVGGIQDNNNRRAEFIYNNLTIQNNIIHYSYVNGVKKLLFLGSSCIYPKLCPQPIKEEFLLTGELEQTNEPYAIAKIAGLKMVENYARQYGCNFISVMPTNLYGSLKDNYDLEKSHVFAAMIRKFSDAKKNNTDITLWGDGTPYREFLHIDDLSDALIFLMLNYNDYKPINIGTGQDLTIKELATKISKENGFKGNIIWDNSKPNGTPKKLLDVSKINNLGWKSKISIDEGIKRTITIYEHNSIQ
jgi:GDP-L-fucose synthase